MLFGIIPIGVSAEEENGGIAEYAANVATVTLNGDSSTETAYSDIEAAFTAAQTADSAEIKLTGDADLGSNNVVLKSGNITLDLNGCTLSGSYDNDDRGFIMLGANKYPKEETVTLTVCDKSSSADGKITNLCRGAYTPVIYLCSGNADLKVLSGTVEMTKNQTESSMSAVIYAEHGTATVSGGKIKGSCYGILTSNYGKVYVSGDAEVRGTKAGLCRNGDWGTKLSGGTFISSSGRGILIKGGTAADLLADGYTFVDQNNVKVDISGNPNTLPSGVKVVENLIIPIDYIDADGNSAQCTDYTIINSADTSVFNGNDAGKWYVISGKFDVTSDWTISGKVNFILVDDAEVTINNGGLIADGELSVYCQSGAEGKITLEGQSDTALIGGSGTLNLYGGNISAVNKANTIGIGKLNVYGGNLTVKSEQAQPIDDTVSAVLADDIKVVKTDSPDEKGDYKNTDGVSVTFTKCTEHKFRYEASETVGKHKCFCELCSTSGEAEHKYELPSDEYNAEGHKFKCACGEKAETFVSHTYAYTADGDGMTHSYMCNVCGYKSKTEKHSFENEICSVCGLNRTASVKSGEDEFAFTTFKEAVDKAMKLPGSVVTIHTDLINFDLIYHEALELWKAVNINSGTFTIDFGGHTFGSVNGEGVRVNTVLIIGDKADITLKNGKINLAGVSTTNDAAIYVKGGKLTLENITVQGGLSLLWQCHAISVMGGKLAIKENVVLANGFEADENSEIEPLTSGSFICSSESLKGNKPTIKAEGKTIYDLLAPGYSLAKADDPSAIVPIYDEFGADLLQISDNVQVVKHSHGFTGGVCACGLKCAHNNYDEQSGKCTSCGEQAAAKLSYIRLGVKETEFCDSAELAAYRVKAMHNIGGKDITLTLFKDLDSDWTISDAGEFNLTTADGVSLTKSITADSAGKKFGETVVTIIGGTYGKQSTDHSDLFGITCQNGGMVKIKGGSFYSLGVGGDVYTVADITESGYAFYRKDAKGNSKLYSALYTTSFGPIDSADPVFVAEHTNHVYSRQPLPYGMYYIGCDCGIEAAASITRGENTVYYSDFEEALNVAEDGDTIVICGSIQPQKDIVIDNKGSYGNPITIDLNGKGISFTKRSDYTVKNGHKLIINNNSFIRIAGSGEITSLYSERYAMTELLGGTYGTIESPDGVLTLHAVGYGIKGADGWIENRGTKVLNDVTVQKAPYEIKNIIVTTDPNGTTDSDTFYTGQKIYVKATVQLDDGEQPISSSKPYRVGVSTVSSSGAATSITFCSNDSADFVYECVLPDQSGEYELDIWVDYLGCRVVDGTKKITAAVCEHNYEDGVCKNCGVECAHQNISETGVCGTCGLQMAAEVSLNGNKSYYKTVAEAFAAAENNDSTVKLLKDVTLSEPIAINNGNLTLDLNGKQADLSKIELSGGKMTVKSSEYVLLKTEIVISNNAELTVSENCGIDTVKFVDNASAIEPFKVNSDAYIGMLIIEKQNPALSLSGGKFGAIRGNNISGINLLEDGYIFSNADSGECFMNKQAFSDSKVTFGDCVLKVVKCTHLEPDGNLCKYCNIRLAGAIGSYPYGSNRKYYTDIKDVFSGTITEDKYVRIMCDGYTTSEDIVLDGAKIQYYTNGGKLIFADGKSLIVKNGGRLWFGGDISSITVENGGVALPESGSVVGTLKIFDRNENFLLEYGSYGKIEVSDGDYTIADFLKANKTLKHTDGTWATDAELGAKQIENVEIKTKPIINERLDADCTSMVYGAKDKVTLTATFTGEGTASYKWYKDGMETSGAAQSEYTDNSVLDAGKHKYECVIMLDGYSRTVSCEVNVDKADPVYTAPTAKTGLIYNGSQQGLLETQGATAHGTIKYSLDGENWSTDVPTAEKADEYTVYYKIEGDKNHNGLQSELTTEIAKRQAKIANNSGSLKGYPETCEYGAVPEPRKEWFEITDSENGASFNWEWYDGDTKLDRKPEELGSYKLKVIVGDTENTIGASIVLNVTVTANTNTFSYGPEVTVYNNPNTVSYDELDLKNISPFDAETIEIDSYTVSVQENGQFQPYDPSTSDFQIAVQNGDSNGAVHIEVTGLSGKQNGEMFCIIIGNAHDKHYQDIILQIRLIAHDREEKELGAAMNSFTYGDTPAMPEYTAPTGTLKQTVSYAKDGVKLGNTPTDAGEYTVTVVCDTKSEIYKSTKTYEIRKRQIGDSAVNIEYADTFVYDGNSHVPVILVKMNGVPLRYSVDYRLTYPSDAKNAGVKNIKIEGIGNFSGEKDLPYVISRRTVTPDSVSLDNTIFTYDGTAKTPAVTVTDGTTTLNPETDYTVRYSNNTNAGTASVTVTGKGNYSFEITKEFVINKANVKVKVADAQKEYGEPAPNYALELVNSADASFADISAINALASFECDGSAADAAVTENGYEINATLTTDTTDNFDITVESMGKLTVKKALLTVKVKDVTREYGADNPTPEVEYTGFKNGETEAVLGGELQLTYADDINSETAVGDYSERIFASGRTSNNYDIHYEKGNVHITKIGVTASAGTAKSSYITVVLDRAVEGLAAANFTVKDSGNNVVAITGAAAAALNKNYILNGSFAAGKEYTVTVTLTGTSADATHTMVNGEFTVKPASSGGGGGGNSAPTSYTVKFETNGGSAVSSVKVDKNEKVSEPTMPEKDGYTFGGWYTDKELKTKYDFSEKVTQSFTLYAAWTKKDTEPDTPVNPEWKNPFTDVEKDKWYYENIRYAVENGLFGGVTETTFDPNGLLTRAMLVTVLWRAEGKPQVNYAMPFNDVDEESYFAEAVRWAASEGIVNGYSETEFAPDQNITREQIAAIMFRYAKYKGVAPTGEWAISMDYADLGEISDYAAEAVMYCKLKNIMQGKDNNNFAPQDNATRAETAAIMQRFIEGNK